LETANSASIPAPARRTRRRTIPIIDARFQWKYTLIITALGVGITAVMGAFLYRAHSDNTRLLDLDGNTMLLEQVIRGDRIFLLYLIVLVIAMALALAFWGLVVTHRVSGPLFVIARYFGELADGRYPDLRPLRRHDELQDFFAAFEDAVAGLKARDGATLRSIEDAIAAINQKAAADPQVAIAEALRAIEQARTSLTRSD
jgi:hypothetical protein